MKKYFVYGGVFIVAYLIFLLVSVPASVIVSQVSLPSHVSLLGVSGSATNIKIKQVKFNDLIVDNVNVVIDTSSLLLFNPTLAVTFGDNMIPGPSGHFTLSGVLGEVRAQNVLVEVDANRIVQKLALPIPVIAHNQLKLEVEDYLMGQPLCQVAKGQALWKEASVTSFNETVNLGQLSAQLNCSNGKLALQVKPDNDLGLSILATIGDKGKFSGKGFIQPSNRFPKKLQPMLGFIGKPDQIGRYQLAF